jgi:hypothetical protein
LAPADQDNLNDVISTLRKAERDSDEEDEFDA